MTDANSAVNLPTIPAEFPREGRLVGIDYGTVRIGVAITDATQQWPSPWENYNRKDLAADLVWFQKLVKEERVVGIVIGLPVHISGLESQKSIEVRAFAKWLQAGTGLPIRLFDERYSSAQAEEMLLSAGFTKKSRKERLDKLAAQIILASFLESDRSQQKALPLEDGK